VLAPPGSTSGGLILRETLGVYQKVQPANPSASFEWGLDELAEQLADKLDELGTDGRVLRDLLLDVGGQAEASEG